MARRALPVFCPSVSDGAGVFTREPCAVEACTWWAGRCTAADAVLTSYAPAVGRYPVPACPKKVTCRWHTQAMAEGLPACPPRRLGETCEHVGGQWNTFDMAPVEEWDLGLDLFCPAGVMDARNYEAACLALRPESAARVLGLRWAGDTAGASEAYRRLGGWSALVARDVILKAAREDDPFAEDDEDDPFAEEKPEEPALKREKGTTPLEALAQEGVPAGTDWRLFGSEYRGIVLVGLAEGKLVVAALRENRGNPEVGVIRESWWDAKAVKVNRGKDPAKDITAGVLRACGLLASKSEYDATRPPKKWHTWPGAKLTGTALTKMMAYRGGVSIKDAVAAADLVQIDIEKSKTIPVVQIVFRPDPHVKEWRSMSKNEWVTCDHCKYRFKASEADVKIKVRNKYEQRDTFCPKCHRQVYGIEPREYGSASTLEKTDIFLRIVGKEYPLEDGTVTSRAFDTLVSALTNFDTYKLVAHSAGEAVLDLSKSKKVPLYDSIDMLLDALTGEPSMVFIRLEQIREWALNKAQSKSKQASTGRLVQAALRHLSATDAAEALGMTLDDVLNLGVAHV